MRVPVSLQNICAGIYRFTLILARGNAAVAKGMLTVAFFALAAACSDVLPTAPEPVSNIGLRLDTSVGGATVTTDRLDYPPGDTVTITGTGWQPGETVSFLLNEDPEPTHALYNWTTIASDSGTIFDRSFVPNESHLGVTFRLDATGVTSGRSATRDFTDGNATNATLTLKTVNAGPACGTAATSFSAGSSVCAEAVITVGGNGIGGDDRIQWYLNGATNPARDILFTNVSNGAIQQDIFAPPSGSWVIKVCKTANAGTCSPGNILAGATTSFVVRTAQAIDFAAPPTRTYGDVPFTVSATGGA